MTSWTRAHWWLAASLLAWGGGVGCQGTGRRPEIGGIGGWAAGPTRWLMLPEEEREARRLATNREAVSFLESFWRRRDPDLEQNGNPVAQMFYERVEAADRLYGEGGVRGSLTDRGRALLLLGPPPVLSYNQRTTPAWDPNPPRNRPALQTRRLVLETWTYPADSLAPDLLALLDEEGRPHEVVLVFVIEPDRATLTDGGKLLDLAVRALVRRQ
jgi:GWxTD domain-containing protein